MSYLHPIDLKIKWVIEAANASRSVQFLCGSTSVSRLILTISVQTQPFSRCVWTLIQLFPLLMQSQRTHSHVVSMRTYWVIRVTNNSVKIICCSICTESSCSVRTETKTAVVSPVAPLMARASVVSTLQPKVIQPRKIRRPGRSV